MSATILACAVAEAPWQVALSEPRKARDGGGASALHYAAQNGHADVVRFLVNECGIAVDISDYVGHTPLISAVLNASIDFDIVRVLVKECGATVEFHDG